MKFSKEHQEIPVDTWVWGKEMLLWGYDPEHKYTLKILHPKIGREGCMSLQYHREKSETWFVLEGSIWAVFIEGDQVITRVMHKGDFQNLPTGTVHRMMGLTDSVRILESSTPDAHAADKSVEKDVVRLHCVHGRDCEQYEFTEKQHLIDEAIRASEEAIAAVNRGETPSELNLQALTGADHIDF
ncbi:MAG: hypothetical protein KDD70_00930 [Bdellovibrionales bacterium]|nr:hypothetical protein [Bdellovibrionales bacterium]